MKQCSVLLLIAILARVSATGTPNKCNTCRQELTDLKSAILPQLTQDSISEFLDIVCESYPENERTACSQSVAAHSVPILALLESMNVEGVCTALGQCDDELGMSPFLDVTIVSRNDTTDFELEYRGMICAACTTTMSFLHSMLSDRAVKRAIVRVLTRFCYFTGSLRLQCLSFLKRYGTMMLDLAETKLTPKLCKTLHLCNRVVPVSDHVSSGMFCSVCKRVTSTVRFLIHSRDNERRVIALAKYMCHKLPSPFNFMCEGLVSYALPQLFDYLRSNCQMIGHLCKMLGFCPRQDFAAGSGERYRGKAIDEKKYPKLFFVPKQKRLITL